MKFKKILMIEYSKGDLGTKQEKRLSKLGQEIIMLSKDNKDISRHLSTSDSLLVKLGASVDKSMIDKAPNLKYIGILGTGYGRIDTEYAAKKNYRLQYCRI